MLWWRKRREEPGRPPRILVHMGLHKTGSTAIQEYLHSARGSMAEVGFVYPDLGSANHFKLAVAVAGDGEAGRASLIGYMARHAEASAGEAQAVRQRIADHVARLGDDWLILSHENFAQPARLRQLVAFLKEIAPEAEVHALAYVRSPPSLYPSVVQQVLKVRRIARLPAGWKSNHEERAALIRATFGERATIRVFDRNVLAEGDVIADIRATVHRITGRWLPPSRRAYATHSAMAAPICALLFRYNKACPEGEIASFAGLRDALIRFASGRGEPKLVLPADWRALIAARHQQQWNTLIEDLDYDPAALKEIRLSPESPGAPKGRSRTLEQWLGGYEDPAFNRAFLEWLGTDPKHAAMIDADARAWMEARV
jgi:hypothetical protein